MPSSAHEISALLKAAGQGQSDAMERLLPLVYDELRRLAHHHRFAWRHQPAPGTRSLVHEAFLKLADLDVDWQSRAQFFFLASRVMRSILVDNARRFARQKREGGRQRVPLSDELMVSEARSEELLALDEALERLASADAHLSRIVECRVFGGLTIDETAEALGISPATVKRNWNLARAWLQHEMGGTSGAIRGPEASQDA